MRKNMKRHNVRWYIRRMCGILKEMGCNGNKTVTAEVMEVLQYALFEAYITTEEHETILTWFGKWRKFYSRKWPDIPFEI